MYDIYISGAQGMACRSAAIFVIHNFVVAVGLQIL